MRDSEEPQLLSLLKELVDALGTLVAGHLRLARAELGDDARRLGRRAAVFGLALALGLLGYGLLAVSAALALAPRWGGPAAFAALGAVHVLSAAVGLGVLIRRAAPRPLDASLAALDRTVSALASPARLPPEPAEDQGAPEAALPARAADVAALEGAVP
jgi:uncharacterized membrane protein YqjE